jgi:hypothetical protein
MEMLKGCLRLQQHQCLIHPIERNSKHVPTEVAPPKTLENDATPFRSSMVRDRIHQENLCDACQLPTAERLWRCCSTCLIPLCLPSKNSRSTSSGGTRLVWITPGTSSSHFAEHKSSVLPSHKLALRPCYADRPTPLVGPSSQRSFRDLKATLSFFNQSIISLKRSQTLEPFQTFKSYI